jgi:hypothetical protein
MNKKNMKVYCKNCFHTHITFYSVIRKKIIYQCCFGDDINENNDCKEYKRKWYKFWVKKNT